MSTCLLEASWYCLSCLEFRTYYHVAVYMLFANSSKRTSLFYSFRTHRVPTIHELKGKSVVQAQKDPECAFTNTLLQRTVLQHTWLTATYWKKHEKTGKQNACIACEETRLLPSPRVAPPGRPRASRANPSPRTLCPLSLSDKQTEWQFGTKHHKATKRQSLLVACHGMSLHNLLYCLWLVAYQCYG